uniref:C2 domain-containing protein n=1 Tax=Macrostomum lignano TaxID=282301 RepID=A0A1I8FBJ4_9PLAT
REAQTVRLAIADLQKSLRAHGAPSKIVPNLSKEAVASVTLKIVPSLQDNHPMQCEIYVKAMFNYSPDEDDLNPAPRLAFGSALASGTRRRHAGQLIPSPELQEWRTACSAIERAKKGHGELQRACSPLPAGQATGAARAFQAGGWRPPLDQLEMVTYEEVVSLGQFSAGRPWCCSERTGWGRRHIKNTLIQASQTDTPTHSAHHRPPNKNEAEQDAITSFVARNYPRGDDARHH